MMGAVTPPPSVMGDALALLRLVQDPAAVEKQLEAIATASASHEASLQQLRAAQTEGMRAVEARNKDLDARESKLLKGLQALDSAQRDFDSNRTALDAREAELTSRSNALVARERALNEVRATANADLDAVKDARARLVSLGEAFERGCVERTKDLDAREAVIEAAETAYAARIAKFREAVGA